jgi:hypothetical protein
MLLGGVASPWPWDEIAFIFSLANLLTARAGPAGSPWIVPRGGAGAPTFGTPGRLKGAGVVGVVSDTAGSSPLPAGKARQAA